MKSIAFCTRNLLFFFFFCCSLSSWSNDFVVRQGDKLRLYMPHQDRPVAETALGMFIDDARRTLQCTVQRTTSSRKADIVMSLSHELPQQGFRISVRQGRIHITAADAHGLAYALMHLSGQMGVSPWEYWADCAPHSLSSFSLPEGYHVEESPAVEYRGIFINDEDWGLNPWATRQEPEAWTIHKGGIRGAIGPKVNERIFQLMLRLRANYYWPAMHECSQPFFSIPGNREMAARYGIYVGGSHCEPMATSPAAEWAISGHGDYNYVTNRAEVQDFWLRRLREVKDQEVVYTLGMRGVHDGSMQGVKTMDEKLRYLQMVIDDQREMLRTTHPRGTDVPQVFVPYKEVLDIYRFGLRVPDDVTLMWTDDNYGYIRHFPDSVEASRSGGNGVYYHVSYWGRPHDYLWLNSLSPDLLQSEMLTAYDRGIRKMWILNVGDIKPSEYQIELFMQLAWDGTAHRDSSFLHHFVQREFGSDSADEIVDVLNTYFRLSAEMKPEHMAGTRVEESDRAYWNKIHPIPGDWTKNKIARRVADYQDISDRVERLNEQICPDRRDAFFQLVKYPVQAAAQMNFKFLWPERCELAYDSIQTLTHIYNKVSAGGKWDGIMSASPRNLPVFQRVTADMLPQYPDTTLWQSLPRNDDVSWTLETPLDADSVTLRVLLLPNHPITDSRLAFRLVVDGVSTPDIEYQTYDRSEEWKQNVLRGHAIRDIRVPLSPSTRHSLQLVPLTPGVRVIDIQK